MADNVSALIGQMIDPQPGGLRNPAPIAPMRSDAPLPELVGRIMEAPGRHGLTPVEPVPLVAELIEPPPARSTEPQAG